MGKGNALLKIADMEPVLIFLPDYEIEKDIIEIKKDIADIKDTLSEPRQEEG